MGEAAEDELDRAYTYDEDDDSPFCECQLEPVEDEDAANQCAACGKPLR